MECICYKPYSVDEITTNPDSKMGNVDRTVLTTYTNFAHLSPEINYETNHTVHSAGVYDVDAGGSRG